MCVYGTGLTTKMHLRMLSLAPSSAGIPSKTETRKVQTLSAGDTKTAVEKTVTIVGVILSLNKLINGNVEHLTRPS